MFTGERPVGVLLCAPDASEQPDGAEAARILNGYKVRTGVRAGHALPGVASGIQRPPFGPGGCAACGLVFHPDRLRDEIVNPAVDLGALVGPGVLVR